MTAMLQAPADDLHASRAAVEALTRAIELLQAAGASLPRVKFLTDAAVSDANGALMIAANEVRLAERERSSNALTPAQQEALGRPCLCYPLCAAEG